MKEAVSDDEQIRWLAYRKLALIEPDEKRRDEVLKIIPHRRVTNNAPRVEVLAAYCNWAGPKQSAHLYRIATTATTAVKPLAIRKLLKYDSPYAYQLALTAVRSGLYGQQAAWARYPNSERLLCRALSELGVETANPSVVQFLGETGGARSLAVLNSVLRHTPSRSRSRTSMPRAIQRNGPHYRAAIEKIETRIRANHETSGG